ncbi:IS3 family transposase [Chromohalobacter israelensis]|uniref:IS3 family transposase n=1 Tax=Chromohalobacter israelensis TaxID=141390 RepID=UPI0012EB5A31|nr:IS3 family transposase [Chromohalobacter israelensis]MDF9433128.1 IS3 family transposase [Chromohalobacter israelensis]
MARQAASMKKTRTRYSQDYKAEALALADRVGISAAARELGLQPSQLYQWRAKAQQQQSASAREQALADENARLKRQLAEKSEELEINKKGGRVLRQAPQVKYAFIHQHRQTFSIQRMCGVLGVARSGYYAWRQRDGEPSPRRRQQAVLDQRVAEAFKRRKGRSGAPRLVPDLVHDGMAVNRKTIAASLRRQGLRAKAARKFKATTNSRHSLPVAPNLLEQDFTAMAPNEKWVGDITYLATGEGWLYLAVLIDLFSRKVIGWAMSERMTADLAGNALQMALWRRKMPKKVVVHSDRGSQYCSTLYQSLLTRHDLQCSMSAKGNCYDNACAESFFHSLKVEAIHGERFETRDAMRRQVFEYIEMDYNRQRRHSAIGMISPEAFEARMIA